MNAKSFRFGVHVMCPGKNWYFWHRVAQHNFWWGGRGGCRPGDEVEDEEGVVNGRSER